MWLKIFWLVILVGGVSVAAEARPSWEGCLPSDISADEVIAVEPASPNKAARQVTVKGKLNQLGARCRNKRLVDAKGKQIHFFRLTGCWGNPPENYEEILNNQQKELAELRKRYRVIEITCNPIGHLIQ